MNDLSFLPPPESPREPVKPKLPTMSLGRGIVLVCLTIMLTGFGVYVAVVDHDSQTVIGSQTAPIDHQQNVTAKEKSDAQNQQINTLTQQVSGLTDQLKDQATSLNQAKQQAALAQQAANLASQQAKSSSNNSLPQLNTSAIVTVICNDGLGDQQLGSGTIVDSSGYILTNKHVVTDSSGNLLSCGMLMRANGESSIMYKLSMIAPRTGFFGSLDAAMLKVDSAINLDNNQSVNLPNSFPFLTKATTLPAVGSNVYILGYPAASNFVFNATRGIVSSFSTDGAYINTDATIDHGNSGGAAVNSDGQLIGIPSQKYVGQDNDYLGQILRIDKLDF